MAKLRANTIASPVHHHAQYGHRLVTILRAAIAGRYRKAFSSFLIASEQRRVNPARATMDSDQERETQIYDSSLHGVGPSSDRVTAGKARSRYDSSDSTRHQAPR
jgi:hypothetical protein